VCAVRSPDWCDEPGSTSRAPRHPSTGLGWQGVGLVLDADLVDGVHLPSPGQQLGDHVTLIRIHGGRHDLVLSQEEPRRRFLDEIRRWLELFHRRFFTNQFKRSTLPNGPKVVAGGSLSPRGDWRMPSDAAATAWLAELERNVPRA